MKKLLILMMVFCTLDRFIIYKIKEMKKSEKVLTISEKKEDSQNLKIADHSKKGYESGKSSAT